MNSNEKFLSVFGIYHQEQKEKKLRERRESKEMLSKVVNPVEGLDFLHEDSKAETQLYQDMYDSMYMKEVELTRCKIWRNSEEKILKNIKK
jgi:hypothetical protein